jgi:hypothetical protein
MEKAVDRVVRIVMSGVAATAAALSLVYIAHYDFGFSREEIRGPALIGAGIIAALVAAEFFAERLRKLR